MPILQSRLLRLLEAGESAYTRYDNLRARLSDISAKYTTHNLTAEDAMLAINATLMVTPEYIPAVAVLREERIRYQVTYSKNQSEKQRLRRRKAGIPTHPRPHAQPLADPPPFTDKPTAPPPEALRILDDMAKEDQEIDAWAKDDMTPAEEAEWQKYLASKNKEGE